VTWLTWVAARPDGVLFAIGDENGRIRVWMPADNRIVASHETGKFVKRVGWSCDGKLLLATGDAGVLHVFNDDGTERVGELATKHPSLRSFGVHPSRPNVVATTGKDAVVRVWDLATGEPTLELPPERAAGTAVGLANGFIAAGLENGVFSIWDDVGKELAGGQIFNRYISALAARADGSAFVFAGGGGHMVEISNEWKSRTVWKDPPKPIATNSIEIAPDGRMLSARSDSTARLFKSTTDPYGDSMGSAFYIDRKSWEQKYIVSGACFVPATTLLATSHFAGSIQLWQTIEHGYALRRAEVRFTADDQPQWHDDSGAPIADSASWWLEHSAVPA